MLSISLPAAVEQRLSELAKSRGLSESDLARELIEGGIEDLEDTELAVERLARPQPALSAEQARKALGLDD